MAIVSGNTVAQLRYFDITNITGGTVTLEAGHAYRLNATTGTKTLYAEEMADDTFGLEGHIEIFVANTGSIQTGKLAGGTTEVILADALEPDAVNNCTVRFHDHKAIISVEDHVAGHIVTVSAGTVANSLYYWLTQPNTAGDAATQYVGFDATLNGTPVNFEGAANTAVKHVVGNGYTQTLLTGNVAPAAALTVSDLGLQNVTVTGGTLTLGDAYIPSGSTVAVSGGGLAVEKVTGNGGVIDLNKTHISNPLGASLENVIITGGSESNHGGAVYINAGSASFRNVTFSSNSAGSWGGAICARAGAKVVLTGCTFSENVGTTGVLYSDGTATYDITDCVLGENQSAYITGSSTMTVKNTLKTLSVVTPSNYGNGKFVLSSGAILDLTGNTNATPIAPGGGITFEAGGATVKVGDSTASSSYMMDNVTLPASAKLTNTAVVNLGGTHIELSSGSTASASGAVFTSGGDSTFTGGAFLLNLNCSLVLSNCTMSGNVASRGGAVDATRGGLTTRIDVYGGIISGNTASATSRGFDIFTQGQLNIFGATVGKITCVNGARVNISGTVANDYINVAAAGYSATVTISSGASINLTSSINPGGTGGIGGADRDGADGRRPLARRCGAALRRLPGLHVGDAAWCQG